VNETGTKGYPVKSEPTIDRFWKYVNKTDTCWLWTGYIGRRRRGIIYPEGERKSIAVHRFSYQHFVGPIPAGMYVCHHCDNPSCVRPDHLFLGTQTDNMRDMVKKGRSNKPTGESNGRAKLTDDAVRFIRENYKFRSKQCGQKQLARKFGVCVQTIQEVLDGRKWSHVT